MKAKLLFLNPAEARFTFSASIFAGRQISCNPKPKSLHQVERNPFSAGRNDLANYTGARSLNPRNTGRKVGYVRVRVDELARREDPCRKMDSMLPLFVHEGFPQYDSGMRVDVRFEAGRQHFVAHRHANFFACSGETLRVASRYAGGDCGRSRQPQRQASCH